MLSCGIQAPWLPEPGNNRTCPVWTACGCQCSWNHGRTQGCGEPAGFHRAGEECRARCTYWLSWGHGRVWDWSALARLSKWKESAIMAPAGVTVPEESQQVSAPLADALRLTNEFPLHIVQVFFKLVLLCRSPGQVILHVSPLGEGSQFPTAIWATWMWDTLVFKDNILAVSFSIAGPTGSGA